MVIWRILINLTSCSPRHILEKPEKIQNCKGVKPIDDKNVIIPEFLELGEFLLIIFNYVFEVVLATIFVLSTSPSKLQSLFGKSLNNTPIDYAYKYKVFLQLQLLEFRYYLEHQIQFVVRVWTWEGFITTGPESFTMSSNVCYINIFESAMETVSLMFLVQSNC